MIVLIYYSYVDIVMFSIRSSLYMSYGLAGERCIFPAPLVIHNVTEAKMRTRPSVKVASREIHRIISK